MAHYRNDDDDRTLPGVGMNRTPETDPEHLLADHTSAVAPGTIPAASMSDDPDTVRDEIERTRARMSRTIDELDKALVRKKEQVQEKLDVAAPIRQSPWTYAAGVFGAGIALGLITGGGKSRDDDEDRDHVKIPRELLASIGLEQSGRGRSRGSRSGSGSGGESLDAHASFDAHESFDASYGAPEGDWEERARELMAVVARQEEEIRTLRGAGLDEEWMDDGTDVYLTPTDARLLDDVEALAEADVVNEWDEEWNFEEGDVAEEYGESYTAEYDEGELEAYAQTGIDFKKPLAMLLAAGVAGALGTVGRRMLGGRGGGDAEMEVEVELEPRGGMASDVYVDEAGRSARRAARHQAGYGTQQPVREYGPEYGVEGEWEAAPAPPHGTGVHAQGGYTAEYRGPAYTGEYRAEAGYQGEMEVEVELEQPVRRSLPKPRRRPRVSPLAGAVAAGAAAAVSGMVAKLLQNRAERAAEMEVEVELESTPRPAAPRRSPAPARPTAGYTPQPAPRPQAAGGELEIEVELEERGRTPGAWTPSAHPQAASQQGISGSAFGTTGSTGTSRPSDLDVDAETRGATGAAGGNAFGSTGGSTGTGSTGGTTGTGGTSGQNDPPLM
ncbi:MAG TPA: DUF3618 domain-containing protein [Longimicrobium sp.]